MLKWGAEATAEDGHLPAPSFHGMINTTPHLANVA